MRYIFPHAPTGAPTAQAGMEGMMATTVRYAIGTKFRTRGKHPRVCEITDILRTFNNAGDCVRVRYVAKHQICGQDVIDHDVCDVTVSLGLITDESVAA